MAALAFVVLAHTKAHMRGERVSAGPGIEYMVGPDGLLYQTGTIKSGGKVRYSKADLPGVHPDHVAALTKSANIRVVEGYKGPVANGPAPTAAAPGVSRAEYDKVVAERDAAVAQRDALRAQLLGHGMTPATDAPAAVAKPKGPPPAPPAEPPAAPPAEPPAPPAGDNPAPSASDIAAILGVGVGKLGADLAAGKHDGHLQALRAAEVAGKNRSGALAVIDARIKALAG